jgi:hypothetical protein
MLTVRITEVHALKLGLKSPEILKVHNVAYITEICHSGAYLYFIIGEIIDCDPMFFRLWREPEPWELLGRNEEIVSGKYFCSVSGMSSHAPYKLYVQVLSDECQVTIKDVPITIDPVLDSHEIDPALERQLETVSVPPTAELANC